jgi:HK97 family phage major capsid protein
LLAGLLRCEGCGGLLVSSGHSYACDRREAVEDSNPDLRNIVANSLIKDTGVELDRQFVVGDGTGQNMRGLLNISGVTAGPSTGTNGGSLSASGTGFGFLADTLAAYDSTNADPDRAAWIMHSAPGRASARWSTRRIAP